MATRMRGGRPETTIVADIVAIKEESIPLVVKVKAMKDAAKIGVPWLAEEIGQLVANGYIVDFGMFVDLDEIRIIRVGEGGAVETVCILPMAEILGTYDSSVVDRRIHQDYLQRLVARWLEHFAKSYFPGTPPGVDRIRSLGLADLLEGAEVEERSEFIVR
ncbi:hypothetical protein TA3x_003932 [Tundrisphaera sp. TA3]|uniref:hypothetical protein n=1 Tax=Tundrisphaera sp. TA3 TaxID=3435775 RepID=UPI003EBD585D